MVPTSASHCLTLAAVILVTFTASKVTDGSAKIHLSRHRNGYTSAFERNNKHSRINDGRQRRFVGGATTGGMGNSLVTPGEDGTKYIHLAGIFPINGKEGWQGGQVGPNNKCYACTLAQQSLDQSTTFNAYMLLP